MKKIVAVAFLATFGLVQVAPAQQAGQNPNNNTTMYQITMVSKSVTAINYEHRNGSTMVDFTGTPLLPLASGQATVNSKQGSITISASFKKLQPAQTFGKEYLTYVLWAITPEGKPSNLGEILLNGTNSKLYATTNLQSFGMIVTAEPYFAVNTPSDVVVLENTVRPDTRGTFQPITANYELLQRGQYTYDMSNMSDSVVTLSPKVPLEVYEARNAVAIAEKSGAQQYAPDALRKAQQSLANAESLLKSKGDKKTIIQNARDAVQTSADARSISLKRESDEKIAAEQAAQAAATAAAQAKQQQEAAARQQAEMQRLEAERDAAQQAAARAQADAQALQSAQAAAAAQARAKQAQDAAAQAELQQQQLRAALLAQFNRVLPTTDTPRGLKVNMADVLFAFGKYDLQPAAREALAKFSGIVIAHPGLHLSIEGYTDSVGTDAFNQTLSEQRANAVHDYLVQQGLDPSSITATGFGKANPVASNDTADGRQQNRRVEIIISGEIIGSKIGAPAAPAQ